MEVPSDFISLVQAALDRTYCERVLKGLDIKLFNNFYARLPNCFLSNVAELEVHWKTAR